MGLNLNFATYPKIEHLNLRKEGEEGCEQTAVDIKLVGTAQVDESGDLIQKLLGADQDDALKLWRETGSDESPEPVYYGIDEIKSWAQFRSGSILYIAGLEIRPKKIGKFKIKPLAKRQLGIEFSVSVLGISNRELNILTEVLRDEVECRIESDPELFNQNETGSENGE